jgi:hypothetical protein
MVHRIQNCHSKEKVTTKQEKRELITLIGKQEEDLTEYYPLIIELI